MTFLRRAIGWPVLKYKEHYLTQFKREMAAAEATQAFALKEALSIVDGSDLAKDWQLARNMTVAEYRKNVPISEYAKLEPYITRVLDGDLKAMFRRGSDVLMFAVTSGTTSRVKYIPVTGAVLNDYKKSWTVWGVGVAHAHPDIPYGGVVNLVSSWLERQSTGGTPIGSITGLIHKEMHGVLRLTNVLPPSIAYVSESDNRYYLSLLIALYRRDVMMFTTANPATLLLLARKLETWAEPLLKDLRDGTVSLPSGASMKLPVSVRATWTRDRIRRFTEIESVRREGPLSPKSVWPQLALLGLWTGGTLQQFLPMLKRSYGEVATRDHGLSASEGRITLPLADNERAGPLFVSGGFFEFIPYEAKRPAGEDSLLAHELEVGREYIVVLTTKAGLFRYNLGDVVRCVGFYNGTRTPLLEFLHRGSQVASVTGEKVTASQVSHALQRVGLAFTWDTTDVALVPVVADPPYYAFIIERDRIVDVEALTAAMDKELGLVNEEYAQKRRSGRLGTPRPAVVPEGTFARIRDERVRSGRGTLEQYKQPCLITTESEARALGLVLGAGPG